MTLNRLKPGLQTYLPRSLTGHRLTDANRRAANSNIRLTHGRARLADAGIRLTHGCIGVSDASIRLTDSNCSSTYPGVGLSNTHIGLSDADGGLANACIRFSNPNSGPTDGCVWSSDSNRGLTYPGIGLAEPRILSAYGGFGPSMFWSNTCSCMMAMRSIKYRRADKTPTVRRIIYVRIDHIRRLRRFRDYGFFRLSFDRIIVICWVAIWYPLSILVGLPLIVVPKNAWIKYWRITIGFSTETHERRTNNQYCRKNKS